MLRLIQKSDLPKLQGWFQERWGAMPENLPEIGLISGEEDIDKVAGWIYKDLSCGVGWVGWVVSNPDNKLNDVKYIHHLFDGIEMESKRLGIKTLLYTAEKASMQALLEARGYIEGDKGVTQYIKQL